jgi:hypothetical protein
VKRYSVSITHAKMTMLCCLIPFAALFLVVLLKVPLDNLGTMALVVLCPLLHVGMIVAMVKNRAQGKPSCHSVAGDSPMPVPVGSRQQ